MDYTVLTTKTVRSTVQTTLEIKLSKKQNYKIIEIPNICRLTKLWSLKNGIFKYQKFEDF